MIMSLEELEKYIDVSEYDDDSISSNLESIESLIRKASNNNFNVKSYRVKTKIEGGIIKTTSKFFEAGDTLQISRSIYNDGIYTVKEKTEEGIIVNALLYDEQEIYITKVKYPQDIKKGAATLLKYDLEERGKQFVQSETLSRYSVRYNNEGMNDTFYGYPKSLMSFIAPYRKARF